MDTIKLALSIAAISALVGAAPAYAQSAEAEALFTDGDKAMKAGQLDAACDAFEASNRLEARAGTLIRLGECREQQGQLASAWSAYKDALTRVKDPKKKAIATAQIAKLEPQLSHLVIMVPPGSALPGLALTRNGASLDPALWNRAVPINGGTYDIAATAPGRTAWHQQVTVPVKQGSIAVEVPVLVDPKAVVAATPTPHPTTTPARPIPQPSHHDEQPSSITGRRKLALAIGGVAIVGIAAGIVLGKSARGREDDAYARCPDPATPCPDAAEADAALDSAKGRALGANVAFGIAGAAVIGAAVLWFTGAPESAPRVSIIPSAHATTIAIGGHF